MSACVLNVAQIEALILFACEPQKAYADIQPVQQLYAFEQFLSDPRACGLNFLVLGCSPAASRNSVKFT